MYRSTTERQPRRLWSSARRTSLTVLVTWVWAAFVGTAPAAAASDESTSVALKAAEVLDAHCPDVAGAMATRAAEATAVVGPAIAEVSRAFDETEEASLLYWRGRLELCIGQEERALGDLRAFIRQKGRAAEYAGQVEVAGKLVDRAAKRSGSAPDLDAVLVVGGASLGGAAAVFSGLSGWQSAVQTEKQAAFDFGQRDWSATEAIGREGQQVAAARDGLAAVAITSAVACAASLSVRLLRDRGVIVAVYPAPDPGGAAIVTVHGAW